MTFSDLGLAPDLLEAVTAKGFDTPSPIQALTIPALLTSSNDLIAQAQTGTGKTAAFGLPILQRIEASGLGVQALVLVPTRELALQVSQELQSFNVHQRRITPIYGGAGMREQLSRLQKGVDIAVGTPGRILDHLRRGTLKLDKLRYLVLDEADEMLNMGFIEDIETIMAATAEERRTLLFSATMPARIAALAQKFMRDTLTLKAPAQQLTSDLTEQIYYAVRERDKLSALMRVIDAQLDFYGIVFSRTRAGVDELVGHLLEEGYAAEGLHGDVSQAQREKTLRKFKKRQVTILVATDVAARGIDVKHLTHVVNLSLPQDAESYVHRIGRTGRAGMAGVAITFVSSSEARKFNFLRRDLKADIRQGELPSPEEIVATKQARIRGRMEEIIAAGGGREYRALAEELLAENAPVEVLSALLQLAWGDRLTEKNYPEIAPASAPAKPAREWRAPREEGFKKPYSKREGGYQKREEGFQKRDKPKLKTTRELKKARPQGAKPLSKSAADKPVVSAGGFDWSAFEATMAENWDKKGLKKKKN